MFAAPPGASCRVVIKHDQGKASMMASSLFTNVAFHDVLLLLRQKEINHPGENNNVRNLARLPVHMLFALATHGWKKSVVEQTVR